MKHILGMSKSSLDLKGAKGSKLELDFLRLVYAVKEIRRQGENAQGYLIVLTPRIAESAKDWEHKYKCENCVKIIDMPLSNDAKDRLIKEKKRNIAGMVAGATGGKTLGRSSANIGRETGENGLKQMILMLEPKAKQIKDESAFPFGARWDFYGVVD